MPGGRFRRIKPAYFEDEKISRLSIQARFIYSGMWCFADDLGVIPANSQYIRAKVLPYDMLQARVFDEWLKELVEIRVLVTFSIDDGNFYFIKNFLKHQTIDRPNYEDLFVSLEKLTSIFDIQKDEKGGVRSIESLTDKGFVNSTINRRSIVERSPPKVSKVKDKLSKEKLKESESAISRAEDSPAERIFDHWKKTMSKPKAVLDEKRKRLIIERLKHFSEQELLDAVDGCALSDWHMGRDPKNLGKVYNGLDLILRDNSHVEKFIEMKQRQNLMPKSSQKVGAFSGVVKF